jgi:hypothetical protein
VTQTIEIKLPKKIIDSKLEIKVLLKRSLHETNHEHQTPFSIKRAVSESPGFTLILVNKEQNNFARITLRFEKVTKFLLPVGAILSTQSRHPH